MLGYVGIIGWFHRKIARKLHTFSLTWMPVVGPMQTIPPSVGRHRSVMIGHSHEAWVGWVGWEQPGHPAKHLRPNREIACVVVFVLFDFLLCTSLLNDRVDS